MGKHMGIYNARRSLKGPASNFLTLEGEFGHSGETIVFQLSRCCVAPLEKMTWLNEIPGF